MDDERPMGRSRREWLAHCTGRALAFACAPAMAAQTSSQAGHPDQGGTGDRTTAVVLVLGDSLSAEYGLQRGSGWVELLERKLANERYAAKVINASISGETTSGGASRLPALLQQHRPTHLIIELGANDALRGLPLAMTERNLTTMATAGKTAGARVVLIGMQVPPNLGRDYTGKFAALFAAVAKTTQSALVPFLLKGVADQPNAAALFQADGLHPLAASEPTMLMNVWPILKPLLGSPSRG